MIYNTDTSFKSCAGESINTIYLAAYFGQYGISLLGDGESNNTSVAWKSRGSLHLEILPSSQSLEPLGGNGWISFCTLVRLNSEELGELMRGIDLLILRTSPDRVDFNDDGHEQGSR